MSQAQPDSSTNLRPRSRLAIVGAGVIGARHIKAILHSRNADLLAIADPAPAAQQAAESAGAHYFADIDTMLASLKLDGVIVATPTEHHLVPTLSALGAGVHVLVEKPIMPTLEQANQVIEKSRQSDKQILVGHHRRYYPQVHKARELIQSGELGKLIAINGQWNMRKHSSYYQPDWRKKWEAGPVLTNLIHELDSLRFICGEMQSLTAEKSHIAFNYEKEDAAAMVVRFASGVLGTFILSDQSTSPWSWECATGENPAFPRSGQNSVRFMGSDAALEFPNLVLWHHAGQTPDWNHSLTATEIRFALEDAYVAQIDHFCEIIRGEKAPLISAQDATNTLQATLAVFASAESGERIVLQSGDG